jgi:hypothetical protein
VYAALVRAGSAWSRSGRRRLGDAAALAAATLLVTSLARGQPAPERDPRSGAELAPRAGADARLARELESAPPPPSHVVYFQYGVAFTSEQIISPGPICDNPSVPCILGPGGGIAVRAGWRGAGSFYLGGAYELTKQDPNKLYRIALLQQARAEGRYYFDTARVTQPYLAAALGVGGYGNEWKIDTWGPSGSAGLGIEYQITRQTVVGLALNLRLLYFSRFVDTARSRRDPGLAQLLGLDLVLEQRDAVFRQGAEPARAP